MQDRTTKNSQYLIRSLRSISWHGRLATFAGTSILFISHWARFHAGEYLVEPFFCGPVENARKGELNKAAFGRTKRTNAAPPKNNNADRSTSGLRDLECRALEALAGMPTPLCNNARFAAAYDTKKSQEVVTEKKSSNPPKERKLACL